MSCRRSWGTFMVLANQLLRLEIAAVEPREKQRLREAGVRELVGKIGAWRSTWKGKAMSHADLSQPFPPAIHSDGQMS